MKTFNDLILRSRSVRRFVESERLTQALLKQLVDMARLAPSGGNKQPLKYVLSCEPRRNEAVFSCLAWAGYLTGWAGPAEGERPAAYIVVLGDTTIAKDVDCDAGIAAQTILLGVADLGLGGCIIGSVDRLRLRDYLSIPPHLNISLVLALGKPAETVVLERMKNGGVKYWRDAHGIHHVPKRSLSDVLVKLGGLDV